MTRLRRQEVDNGRDNDGNGGDGGSTARLQLPLNDDANYINPGARRTSVLSGTHAQLLLLLQPPISAEKIRSQIGSVAFKRKAYRVAASEWDINLPLVVVVVVVVILQSGWDRRVVSRRSRMTGADRRAPAQSRDPCLLVSELKRRPWTNVQYIYLLPLLDSAYCCPTPLPSCVLVEHSYVNSSDVGLPGMAEKIPALTKLVFPRDSML